MAEAVMPERSSEAVPSEELPRLERPQAIHGGRFMIGYMVVVLMVGAVLVTLAVITRDSGSSAAVETRWASWTPTERGFQRAREIASRIAPRYRGANGEQFVAVTAQPGEISDLPLQYIALRHGRRTPLRDGDVDVVTPGETAVYSFCGLGGEQTCSLRGEPTAEGGLLLRREALELSLFTFKYLREIQTVVSLLPPVPRQGQAPQGLAVYFQRRHLESRLREPLEMTLPESPQYVQGDVTPVDAETVNRLTEIHFFNSGFEVLPTQTVMLNLEPPNSR